MTDAGSLALGTQWLVRRVVAGRQREVFSENRGYEGMVGSGRAAESVMGDVPECARWWEVVVA